METIQQQLFDKSNPRRQYTQADGEQFSQAEKALADNGLRTTMVSPSSEMIWSSKQMGAIAPKRPLNSVEMQNLRQRSLKQRQQGRPSRSMHGKLSRKVTGIRVILMVEMPRYRKSMIEHFVVR